MFVFFYTRFHKPRFENKPYLTALANQLNNDETLNWDRTLYNRLLHLKNLAAKADASFSQLHSLSDQDSLLQYDLNRLEEKIEQVVDAIVAKKGIANLKNNLTTSFSNFKIKLKESNTLYNLGSFAFILSNAFLSAISIAAFCSACFMISTGPIGMIFLGLALAVLSSALLLLAAYSLYVDGRYKANKQVEEIDAFIDGLFNYDAEPRNLLHCDEEEFVNLDQTVVPVYTLI